jgi:hypothetical protein
LTRVDSRLYDRRCTCLTSPAATSEFRGALRGGGVGSVAVRVFKPSLENCRIESSRVKRERDSRAIVAAMAKAKDDEYTPEEAERRALEAIRRSFTMPHKPLKEFVGKTPRAKAMAKRKAAKGSPKAK